MGVMHHEKMPRVPWVPFAGVHAGKLLGYSAREVLTDADKLVDALLAVNRTYDPDGQPVVLDLQVEAETWGASFCGLTRHLPPSPPTRSLQI